MNLLETKKEGMCLFKSDPKTKDFFSSIGPSLSGELKLIVQLVEQYQQAVSPLLMKIQDLIVYTLEDVLGFGSAKTIGSFCHNLHLPWSDLNFLMSCNPLLTSRKGNSQNKSRDFMSVTSRKQGTFFERKH